LNKNSRVKSFLILLTILLSSTVFGQRISVNGTEFKVNSSRIWLNGTNTPWNKWNDFGGGFTYSWWNDEFQQLKDLHINCTRIWITCDGNNSGISINNDGYISGVTSTFWSHVDQLMEIAQSKQIYIMIALISFDHTKPGNPNASKWINMYNSTANRQAFVNNYAVPFVNRYKNNPYFFAVDVGNELEWVWENHGVASDNVIDLITRVTGGVHNNSEVLVCQGLGAGIKYNTDAHGGSGNYLANANVDFYNIHYYDWQNQWFSNPFDRSPIYYNINTRPCIVGETPAKGAAGYNSQQCYQKAFENGWQGLMVWTSNGIDGNGTKWDSKPGTDWIYNTYPNLVIPAKQDTGTIIHEFNLFQNYPNPFNTDTLIKYDLKTQSDVNLNIYDLAGREIKVYELKDQNVGEHSIKFNAGSLASGMYIYKLKIGLFEQSRKMLLLQ
jgi:hypothetical protein